MQADAGGGGEPPPPPRSESLGDADSHDSESMLSDDDDDTASFDMEIDDDDDDDGDGSDGGADADALDNVAPEPATDDSGDEASLVARAAPPRRRGEGAGEDGRGSYVGGDGWLHAGPRAASSHFQAADALAVGPAADLGGALKPAPGEEDAVLVDGTSVSVWRFPPPPRAGTADAAARPYPAPRLIAATADAALEPYTVARSADGRMIAVGGDLGLVAFMVLEPCRGPPDCELCDNGDSGGRARRATHPPPPPTPAHLRVCVFATLGGLAAVLDNQMVNGLRFGRVAGGERVVAGVQDRYVYFLNKPPRTAGTRGGPPPGAGAVAAALTVSSLAPPGVGGGDRAPPLERTRKVDAHVAARSLPGGSAPDARTRTAAAGPFPAPVNLAVPSPDGTCVAVVGDFEGAFVLRGHGARVADAAPDPAAPPPPPYSVRHALHLSFGMAPSWPSLRRGGGAAGRPGVPGRPAVDVGSQYAAWSPDSSLLAATSDCLHAAFVWHVPRGTPLLRVDACARPALACAFAPRAAATLAFAEAARRAWVVDCRCGPRALAKLPPVERGGGGGDGGGRRAGAAPGVMTRSASRQALAQAAAMPLPRVCGFAVTPAGRVLAATRAGLVEWRLTDGGGWSRARAADAPAAARAATAAFMCVAETKPHQRGCGPAVSGPWSLPLDVVDLVVAAATDTAGAWVGVGAPPRRRPPKLTLLAPPGGATYADVAAMRVPVGGGGASVASGAGSDDEAGGR